jgi:hypothetical protein
LLAPWSDKDGNPHAAEAMVDLSDAEYADLRADGKVQNVTPQELPSHFGDITGRPGVAEDLSVPAGGEPTEPVRTPQQVSKPRR